jgi:hypothetical protein
MTRLILHLHFFLFVEIRLAVPVGHTYLQASLRLTVPMLRGIVELNQLPARLIQVDSCSHYLFLLNGEIQVILRNYLARRPGNSAVAALMERKNLSRLFCRIEMQL